MQVVNLSKNKCYSTAPLFKKGIVAVSQIVVTRDPNRYMLASNRGLLVITLVETESSGLFGKSAAYSLRCAKYFTNSYISHFHALSDILLVVSTSQKVILFDIFDNSILKQVSVSDVNSIRMIEDTRVT